MPRVSPIASDGKHFDNTVTPLREVDLLITLALVVLVVGGLVLGILALLVRTNSSLLQVDRSVAPWGEQHMTSFSQHVLDVVTSFGGTAVIVGATIGVVVVGNLRPPRPGLPAL